MIKTIGVQTKGFGEGPDFSRFTADWFNEDANWLTGLKTGEIPMPVDADGGIGDGAGGLVDPSDAPIPVDTDGGIGDGAVGLDELSTLLSGMFEGSGAVAVSAGEAPISIEPDGGIGDGAQSLDDLLATPIPVDADGGIGDGAGPFDELDGIVTILPYPMPGDGPFPVDVGDGIGDGAGPLEPEVEVDPFFGNQILGGGEGTAETDVFFASDDADTFIFSGSHGEDVIYGFEVGEDTLDLSLAMTDFEDLASLRANAYDIVDQDSGFVYGVYITTGDNSGVFIDGVTSADFAAMDVVF